MNTFSMETSCNKVMKRFERDIGASSFFTRPTSVFSTNRSEPRLIPFFLCLCSNKMANWASSPPITRFHFGTMSEAPLHVGGGDELASLIALQAATSRAEEARKALAEAEKETKSLRAQVIKTPMGKTLLQSAVAKKPKKKNSTKKAAASTPGEKKERAKKKVKEGSGVKKPRAKKPKASDEAKKE